MEDVDQTLYAFLDSDSRTKKDAVEAALQREYGGEKKHALDIRIEHAERRIELINEEIEDLERERRQEQQELETLRKRREEIEEESRSYEDDLQELLDAFVNSRAVLPRFRSDAKELCEEHGVTLRDVEQDLRELADESPYEIDESRWTDDFGEGLE